MQSEPPAASAASLQLNCANQPAPNSSRPVLQGKGGNPNCLCNLVPAPGGFRRQGLWTKAADVLGTLGPDPAANLREVRLYSQQQASLTSLRAAYTAHGHGPPGQGACSAVCC